MNQVQQILEAARARGQEQQLPYAGAVTPQEAYTLLQQDAAIKLIDVRTNAERDWVGRVDIADTQHGTGAEALRELIGLYAPLADRVYCVVFVQQSRSFRIISLRRANAREVKDYDQALHEVRFHHPDA